MAERCPPHQTYPTRVRQVRSGVGTAAWSEGRYCQRVTTLLRGVTPL